jgi:hypothetical protein
MSRARVARETSRGGGGYDGVGDDSGGGGGGGGQSQRASRGGATLDPVFSVQRDDAWRLPGLRASSIRHVASGGGLMAIATSDNQLLLWPADGAGGDGGGEVVELKGGSRPEGGRIHSVFVDPTGRHVLMCMVSAGSGTSYYCSWSPGLSKPQARELAGLRGYVLESVAWGPSAKGAGAGTGAAKGAAASEEGKTGTFLLGTANGRILSARIEDRKEKAVTRLWDTASSSSSGGGGGEALPIVGLHWEGTGPVSPATGEPTRHFVLAVTGRPLRYYEFSGGPTVDQVFSGAGNKGGGQQLFHEIRGGPEAPAAPRLLLQTSGPASKPESVAFLTGVGIFTARLQSGAGGSLSVADPKLVPYPSFSTSATKDGGAGDASSSSSSSSLGRDVWGASSSSRGSASAAALASSSSSSSSAPVPSGLAVTPYHYLLLYRQRVVAVSRVSHGVVFEQALGEDRHGTLRDVVVDGSGGGGSAPPLLFLVSDRYLFRVQVVDEARDVWRLYAAKNDFEAARRFSKGDEARLSRIYEAEAEHMFASGRTAEAAAAFARTNKPFEETCLRFISGGHREALQCYLSLVLDGLKKKAPLGGSSSSAASAAAAAKSSKSAAAAAADRERATAPQRTILCTWLLEMYLDRLNQLHAAAMTAAASAKDSAAAAEATLAAEEEYGGVAASLRTFLRESEADVDRGTALALMSGYGRTAELLFYCRLIGEWGRVVAHHVGRGEWQDALDAIREAPSSGAGGIARGEPNSQEELWYRHSAVLMPILPADTVDGWKDCAGLEPARLIPTLVRYEQVRAAAGAGGSTPSASTAVASTNPASASRASIAAALDMALLYLEWVVAEGVLGSMRRRDPRYRAVHNLLLSLYAAQPVEDPLLAYVDAQLAAAPPAPPAGAAVAASMAGGGGLGSPSVAHLIAEQERAREEGAGEGGGGGGSGLDGAGDGSGGGGGGDDSALPGFDLQYALRVCLSAGRKRACVRLYCALGLYVEAVELALAVDTDLAKDAANRPPRDDVALRKRLWTRVAVHIVAAGGGAAGALAVMGESGCLRIDDVLAYFPGQTTIGDFKEEITESLREADMAIASLRSEMRDYTQAAERIRSDIKSLRGRCGAVKVGQKCDACRDPVLSRHFYLFPCGHAFHSDCLLAEMMRHLNTTQKRRVAELSLAVTRVQTLSAAVAEGGPSVLTTASVAAELAALGIATGDSRASAADIRTTLVTRGEESQAELDAYVAGECLYCGDVMIRSVADPLGADLAAHGDAGFTPRGQEDGDEWRI